MAGVVDLVARIATAHKVTVVALHYPQRRKWYTLAGARVVPLGIAAGRGAPGRAAVLAAGVASLVRIGWRQRIDVIHALWADEPGAVAALAGRLMRVPVVVSAMGGERVGLADIGYGAALGRGGRWTALMGLGAANVVTAGSRYLAQQLTDVQPRLKPVLMPLGVDTRTFSPGAFHAVGDLTVLFVGRLEPVKDPAAAIHVFGSVAARRLDCRLVMCGSGALLPELQSLATDLGIASRVDFQGTVARDDLIELYRSATALVVTSRHEAQHVAAIEAAACGLPVLGYAVGVLPDLDGGAKTVDIGDEKALAAILELVLDDPPLRARMAAAARVQACKSYDLDVTSSAVLNVYERVAH